MNATELATTAPTATLAADDAPRFFTPAQETIIRRSFLSGASPEEAEVLLEVARLRKLNPLLRQIHFVKRPTWNPRTQQNEDVWSFQVAIDGLRAIAERTGIYDGSDEPETTEDGSGMPVVSRVKVWRSDRKRPSVGVARFAEFAQFTKDGKLTKMWREKPFLMLEKCAEALAFRKAFPEDTGGLLEGAEMESGPDEERAPARVATLAPVDSPAALPSAPAVVIDDAAELAGLSEALESCADARTLGKVVSKIGETFGEGKLSAASREVLLAAYKVRNAALKKAAAEAKEAKAAEATGEIVTSPEPEPEATP